MKGLLVLVGFIAIWVFIEYIQKQRHNNGDKLKIIPKTYFLAIKKLISPYQTTEFAEQIINRSQKVLSDILKRYQSFKQQETLRDDDICKASLSLCSSRLRGDMGEPWWRGLLLYGKVARV